ncbi:MAG: hypothetical protein M9962_14990 [Oligoflexia bacterium]|nr:hypothetical protein [Oligoflexia bacterium]
MKILYLCLTWFLMLGCSSSPTVYREPTSANEELPPLAEYVAYVKPIKKPLFQLKGPFLRTRTRVPGPVNQEDYGKKLLTMLGLNPQCPLGENRPNCPAPIGDADYERVQTERAAEFWLILGPNEQIKITAPLVKGKAPSVTYKGVYPADEDSEGFPLIGNSIMEVAHVLAELPFSTRRRITQVDLLSSRSPWDKIYTKIYQRPADEPMRAYMQALPFPLGVVIVPPQRKDNLPIVETMSSTFAHEAGHVWSFQCFEMNSNSEEWQAWREAMALDRNFVSKYAKSSFLEDTAEMALVYAATLSWRGTSKGREYEALLSKKFPHRWAILEKTYSDCGLGK